MPKAIAATTFTDYAGRAWAFELSDEVLAHVERNTGVDLHRVRSGGHYARRVLCWRKLIEIIAQALAFDSYRRGVSPDQFFRDVDGVVMVEAMAALCETLAGRVPVVSWIRRRRLQAIFIPLADEYLAIHHSIQAARRDGRKTTP